MRVLISGAGIAGPTLAYWLKQYGFTPTIVERAPRLRTGGYPVDFWGAGYDIAERMALLPKLKVKGYMVQELRVINRSGRRVAGFPVQAFARSTMGRYITIPRGELSAAIFSKIEGEVEVIFADSLAHLDQTEKEVRVRFERGEERDFDLVVGADGLHSRVRSLVFGPESKWERYLGYKVAAFEVEGYTPRDELAYVMYTELGQQVGRFALRANRTMFHFIFADDDPDGVIAGDIQSQKELIRRRFAKSGWWECQQILAELNRTDDLYFDRVSQIQMDAAQGLWTRGRVTLIGDAASCVSLLAGQGSALAIVAAYILAGELYRADGDYATAFANYQALFGPFVRGKQKAALRFASAFAPKSRMALFVRNQIMNLLRIPLIANLAVGREIIDSITIPEYTKVDGRHSVHDRQDAA
jgi:2-polyprenyl-6-methoxyphenol hydroxylase-like FAD-dependent oxidoreductase